MPQSIFRDEEYDFGGSGGRFTGSSGGGSGGGVLIFPTRHFDTLNSSQGAFLQSALDTMRRDPDRISMLGTVKNGNGRAASPMKRESLTEMPSESIIRVVAIGGFAVLAAILVMVVLK